MSASTVKDRPGLDEAKFAASLVETPGTQHMLTVTGEATGDYRVEHIELVRAGHQHDSATLVLDIRTKLEPLRKV